jgi:peptidoglycan/LPS O-acetylase OafA/YrhL
VNLIVTGGAGFIGSNFRDKCKEIPVNKSRSILSCPRYFRRRLLRLEPPYLINVGVVTIATWVATPSIRPVLIWHFLTAITYTHLLVYHYVNPINMI